SGSVVNRGTCRENLVGRRQPPSLRALPAPPLRLTEWPPPPGTSVSRIGAVPPAPTSGLGTRSARRHQGGGAIARLPDDPRAPPGHRAARPLTAGPGAGEALTPHGGLAAGSVSDRSTGAPTPSVWRKSKIPVLTWTFKRRVITAIRIVLFGRSLWAYA